MTREALKKLNEKQMNYCKTLSALPKSENIQ